MTENNKQEKKEIFFTENTGKKFAIGGIIFIVLAAIIFILHGNWSFSKTLNEEKIAQFGDFIGGIIGSLFSLAGVILFYVALKEQRKDININQENLKLQNIALNQQVDEFKAQKTELIETRKVYEEQTILFREQTNLYKQQNKELKEQTTTAKLQQFDSSFFSYLNMFIDFKNGLDLKTSSKNYFGEIYLEILNIESQDKTLIETFALIQTKYIEVFHLYKNELSLYFKTLYRIIILIDSSSIEEEKKQQYFKLLRSQLSDSELLVLYYNYHSHLGVKVRPYIIKYGLLKHIRILDKIEMGSDLKVNQKFEFEDFLSKIGNYILEGFEKFKSLEEIEDVDLSANASILNVNLEMKLKIISDFNFSLIFKNSEFKNQSLLDKETIIKLVSRQIYSVLFLSKFKLPQENEIKISTIECLLNFEFNFRIENIQNI
jgi:hypothetical protein